HHANEPMRPGLTAESELFVGIILNRLRSAVGAADPEGGAGKTIVAPARELFSQLARTQFRAAFVQEDLTCIVGGGAKERGRFRARIAAWLSFHLDEID